MDVPTTPLGSCAFTGPLRDTPTISLVSLYVHKNPPILPQGSLRLTGNSSLHRKLLLNPYLCQFPSMPSNLSVFLTSSFSVFCLQQILSPTLMGPVPSLIHKCLSQTRSCHPRLSDYPPTNTAQPTYPSHLVCSFQSHKFISIFTVSYDPVLKHQFNPFPVLVVY